MNMINKWWWCCDDEDMANDDEDVVMTMTMMMRWRWRWWCDDNDDAMTMMMRWRWWWWCDDVAMMMMMRWCGDDDVFRPTSLSAGWWLVVWICRLAARPSRLPWWPSRPHEASNGSAIDRLRPETPIWASTQSASRVASLWARCLPGRWSGGDMPLRSRRPLRTNRFRA